MESIWKKTAQQPEYPTLKGDLTTRVAIIGGGLAGINTAYELKRRGIDVVVLEANRIGSGQTCNTTAKITSQHGLIYDTLLETFGEERAQQYAKANEGAIESYREIIRNEKIDCDFMDQSAFLYSAAESDVLERECEAAKKLGIKASLVGETGLPFPVKAAMRFDGQAMFHPLKYLYAVAKQLSIYERTAVETVEDQRILTNRGIVQAEHIVFTTHYPFINAPGYYFLRLHQERSYAIALEDAPLLDGMYLGIDEDLSWSLRRQQNYLILGGSGHRTGENTAGGQYEKLRSAASRYFPQSREVAHWSAQDCVSLDAVPYIGPYSSSTPNWYVATGFRKWGMTHSMVSAKIIADLIEGKENPNAEVFLPQRFEPMASAGEFIKLGAKSAKGLLKRWISLPQMTLGEVPDGHGGIVTHEGEKLGVYKDQNGQAFVVSVRCPHLGCELTWNPDELSWDCPCHGSRFDIEGHLINNPAQEDLET